VFFFSPLVEKPFPPPFPSPSETRDFRPQLFFPSSIFPSIPPLHFTLDIPLRTRTPFPSSFSPVLKTVPCLFLLRSPPSCDKRANRTSPPGLAAILFPFLSPGRSRFCRNVLASDVVRFSRLARRRLIPEGNIGVPLSFPPFFLLDWRPPPPVGLRCGHLFQPPPVIGVIFLFSGIRRIEKLLSPRISPALLGQ